MKKRKKKSDKQPIDHMQNNLNLIKHPKDDEFENFTERMKATIDDMMKEENKDTKENID